MLVLLMSLIPLATGCESSGTKKESSSSSSASPAASKMSSPISPEGRQEDTLHEYVDATRADIRDGKRKIINEVMRLSPEESSKFWPIYHNYENELSTLADQRAEITRKLVTAEAANSLDNEHAASLADEWFQFETRQLEVLQKYHRIIAKELSPIRAAQFTQIEHRVATLVDLVLASELPLIEKQPSPKR
jgi:hypothetical protein